jgi:hypothetical protein
MKQNINNTVRSSELVWWDSLSPIKVAGAK